MSKPLPQKMKPLGSDQKEKRLIQQGSMKQEALPSHPQTQKKRNRQVASENQRRYAQNLGQPPKQGLTQKQSQTFRPASSAQQKPKLEKIRTSPKTVQTNVPAQEDSPVQSDPFQELLKPIQKTSASKLRSLSGQEQNTRSTMVITKGFQQQLREQSQEQFYGQSLLNRLLEVSNEENASDLHLVVGAPPVLRIHGKLVPLESRRLTPQDTREAIKSILSKEQLERFNRKKNIDCTHTLGGGSVRFRVSAYIQRSSVSCVFRAIPEKVKPFSSLGLPSGAGKLHHLRDGLILVVGPTGCGKSTTCATIIDQINENYSYNIITIEDPIEYLHRHKKSLVNQREVHTDVPSFKDALFYALREDPDVLMVGELRDLDTMRTALSAAETGHLVLATMHAVDTVGAADRMVSLFPPDEQDYVRTQLSIVLRAILAQRLLQTQNARQRVLACEYLVNTPAVATGIRTGAQSQIMNALETGTNAGMISFDHSLLQLAQQRLIDGEMALRMARNQKKVQERLVRLGVR